MYLVQSDLDNLNIDLSFSKFYVQRDFRSPLSVALKEKLKVFPNLACDNNNTLLFLWYGMLQATINNMTKNSEWIFCHSQLFRP